MKIVQKKFCNLCGVQHRNTKNNFCSRCRSKIHFNCVGCGKDKSHDIKYLYNKYVIRVHLVKKNIIIVKMMIVVNQKQMKTNKKYPLCYNCFVENKKTIEDL